MGGAFMTSMGGAFFFFYAAMAKWIIIILEDVLKISTGLQGSTLSNHRMTIGFGPFELPNMYSWVSQNYFTFLCMNNMLPMQD